jgi:hypothetical protein
MKKTLEIGYGPSFEPVDPTPEFNHKSCARYLKALKTKWPSANFRIKEVKMSPDIILRTIVLDFDFLNAEENAVARQIEANLPAVWDDIEI